jgi:hypothetical protein
MRGSCKKIALMVISSNTILAGVEEFLYAAKSKGEKFE